MPEKILITGATDGIGLATARTLVEQGHHVLIHGRNPEKLQKTEVLLSAMGKTDSYLSDLSDLADVKRFAETITEKHQSLDVLINNAGILRTPHSRTADGLDVRFVVNTVAPYLLTKKLLPLFSQHGRIINLSSAAQSPLSIGALMGQCGEMEAMNAYSQSKLAITMWSYALSEQQDHHAPVIIAVNPGSLLGSKMVKDGFGIAGKDIRIGADILVQAALSDEFKEAGGLYFDNDSGQFTVPHPDARDINKGKELIRLLEKIIADYIPK
ncbi:SDR family NAD(P)-dependent oxidoreductase [Vibrio quintilis]|uniref:Rhamnolipids biosynthesis 3-oxoacyl-[acyl-carrier-protein] reductase n=1 Tax=Vibrio quintilis TaxID=1117707 RepID=A0A1M7YXB1_9VIBR|nr:SDR family NAD(P)-dependent oxidoreductase [Vibrio quintilis]SHO57319.1 Rhamnolipids biosynthesis 3-oxoacyl-[acyl-carrier-protein] reductase [Vibrio quintilis]